MKKSNEEIFVKKVCMEKKRSLKDIIKNQKGIRRALERHLLSHPATIAQLATKMKISRITLTKFLIEEEEVNLKVLLTINKYLEDK